MKISDRERNIVLVRKDVKAPPKPKKSETALVAEKYGIRPDTLSARKRRHPDKSLEELAQMPKQGLTQLHKHNKRRKTP